jgi:hypothetical protein
MLIRICPPMPSRPCKYCLSLQDDSVFADFDFDADGCLYLVRISYDGYGCCSLSNQNGISKLSKEKTQKIISYIESDSSQLTQVVQILERYFRENKAVLWEDALKDHGLI